MLCCGDGARGPGARGAASVAGIECRALGAARGPREDVGVPTLACPPLLYRFPTPPDRRGPRWPRGSAAEPPPPSPRPARPWPDRAPPLVDTSKPLEKLARIDPARFRASPQDVEIVARPQCALRKGPPSAGRCPDALLLSRLYRCAHLSARGRGARTTTPVPLAPQRRQRSHV